MSTPCNSFDNNHHCNHFQYQFTQSGTHNYNSVSDVIKIDKDWGQGVYLQGYPTGSFFYYNLLDAFTSDNFFELVATWSNGASPGFTITANLGGGGTVVQQDFATVWPIEGHIYSRKINFDSSKTHIVYTVTDQTTGKTETLSVPLSSSGKSFTHINVGFEEWDLSNRTSGTPAPGNPFPPQSDITVSQIKGDSTLVTPTVLSKWSDVDYTGSIQAFTTSNGGYQTVGVNRGSITPLPPSGTTNLLWAYSEKGTFTQSVGNELPAVVLYYAASEEIIEQMSDLALGNGWLNFDSTSSQWEEICDECAEPVKSDGTVAFTYSDGSFGHPFWDNQTGKCVIPGLWSTATRTAGSGNYIHRSSTRPSPDPGIDTISSLNIFVIFWGPSGVSGTWDTTSTGLGTANDFVSKINGLFTQSQWMNGLKQYGINGPVKIIGSCIDLNTTMNSNYTVTDIKQVIINNINSGNALHPSNAPSGNTMYMVIADGVKGPRSQLSASNGAGIHGYATFNINTTSGTTPPPSGGGDISPNQIPNGTGAYDDEWTYTYSPSSISNVRAITDTITITSDRGICNTYRVNTDNAIVSLQLPASSGGSNSALLELVLIEEPSATFFQVFVGRQAFDRFSTPFIAGHTYKREITINSAHTSATFTLTDVTANSTPESYTRSFTGYNGSGITPTISLQWYPNRPGSDDIWKLQYSHNIVKFGYNTDGSSTYTTFTSGQITAGSLQGSISLSSGNFTSKQPTTSFTSSLNNFSVNQSSTPPNPGVVNPPSGQYCSFVGVNDDITHTIDTRTTTTGGGGGGGTADHTVIDRGGQIIPNGQLNVIFWGSGWNGSPTTSKSSIVSALQSLCSGTYFSALSQYRNIQPPSYSQDTTNTTTAIKNNSLDTDIINVIDDSINRGTVSDYSSNTNAFYLVIAAEGNVPASSLPQDGYHFAIQGSSGGTITAVGFVANPSGTNLSTITTKASRLIVEMLTDVITASGQQGFTTNTNTVSQNTFDEITIPCLSHGGSASNPRTWTVNNVDVTAYYSNADSNCVAPTTATNPQPPPPVSTNPPPISGNPPPGDSAGFFFFGYGGRPLLASGVNGASDTIKINSDLGNNAPNSNSFMNYDLFIFVDNDSHAYDLALVCNGDSTTQFVAIADLVDQHTFTLPITVGHSYKREVIFSGSSCIYKLTDLTTNSTQSFTQGNIPPFSFINNIVTEISWQAVQPAPNNLFPVRYATSISHFQYSTTTGSSYSDFTSLVANEDGSNVNYPLGGWSVALPTSSTPPPPPSTGGGGNTGTGGTSPPPPVGGTGGGNDKFGPDGVAKLYPDKAGKVHFFMNMNNPEQNGGGPGTTNPKAQFASTFGGSHLPITGPHTDSNGLKFFNTVGSHVSYASGAPSGQTVRLDVHPNGGEKANPTNYTWKNNPGYLQQPEDVATAEMTSYIRPHGSLGTHQAYAHKINGRDEDPIRSLIEICSADQEHSKPFGNWDYVHPQYQSCPISVTGPVTRLSDGKWLGMKSVHKIAADRKSGVLELWNDSDPFDSQGRPNNNWKLVATINDHGGSTFNNIPCTWGGPKWITRVDGWHNIDFTLISVRSIDYSGGASPPPPGSTGGTGTGGGGDTGGTLPPPPPLDTGGNAITADQPPRAPSGGCADIATTSSADQIQVTNLVSSGSTSKGCWVGAMVDVSGNEGCTASMISAFNALSIKKAATIHFSNHWFSGIKFPQTECDAIKASGATPHIRMMPWQDWGKQGPYSNTAISGGTFDSALTAYANAAKNFGDPILITFGVEINGDWFPWSGNTGQFIAAYKHIVNIFRNVGAKNCFFAYHIAGDIDGHSYYPGDDFVDVIGSSNYGDSITPQGCYKSLDNYYSSILAAVSPNKPLAVFEWSHGNPTDYTNTFANLAADHYPRIKLMEVWHEHQASINRRIDATSTSLAAWNNGEAASCFLSSGFGSILAGAAGTGTGGGGTGDTGTDLPPPVITPPPIGGDGCPPPIIGGDGGDTGIPPPLDGGDIGIGGLQSSLLPATIFYQWTCSKNTVPGTVNDIMTFITHDLVEGITDPYPEVSGGWTSSTFCPTAGVNSTAARCELADQCQNLLVGDYSPMVGYNCWAASYYDNSLSGCTLPGIQVPNGPPSDTFVLGPKQSVLSSVQVVFIFWGDNWPQFAGIDPPTPGSPDDILNEFQLLTTTEYFNPLRQYGINPAPVFNTAVILPSSQFALPSSFTETDIRAAISFCVQAQGTNNIYVPDPNSASEGSTFYYIVIPDNTAFYTNTGAQSMHSHYDFTPSPTGNIPPTNPPSSGVPGVPPPPPGSPPIDLPPAPVPDPFNPPPPTSPPPPVQTKDVFGITQMYPTTAGGREYFSTKWANGHARTVSSPVVSQQNYDPDDHLTELHASGDAAMVIHGDGTMTLSGGGPRFYVHDPYTFPPPSTTRKWKNVEMTVYGQLNALGSITNTESSATTFSLRARSNHQDHTRCLCNGTGYISEWGIRGSGATSWRFSFRKEYAHPHYHEEVVDVSGITGSNNPSMQIGHWVGHKFVCRTNTDNNTVRLESYRDDTGGVNGGNWIKVGDVTDVGTWQVNDGTQSDGTFQTDINSCTSGCLDNHLTNGVNSTDIQLNAAISCYLRTDNVSDMTFKWMSIREVDPISSTTTTQPPPSGNPPGSVGGVQKDQFGVTMIYPTDPDKSSWYMNMTNPASDSRANNPETSGFPPKFGSKTSDGYWIVTNGKEIRWAITQNNGFHQSQLKTCVPDLVQQGYMQDSMDWRDIEMTAYYNYVSCGSGTSNGEAHIEHVMRGQRSTSDNTPTSDGCPISCADNYHCNEYPLTGRVKYEKDLMHTAGYTANSQDPQINGATRKWCGNSPIGWKTIVYNLQDGKSVKLETWVDTNATNNWKKVLEFTDKGQWGGGKPNCHGTDHDVIVWGGPLTCFRTDNLNSYGIKWASIRSIKPFAQNQTTASLPSTTTIQPTTSIDTTNTTTPTTTTGNQPQTPNQVTGNKDKFGVLKIYPDLSTNSERWYLGSHGISEDSRVIASPSRIKDLETKQGDGSFNVSSSHPDPINKIYISTTAGGFNFNLQFSGVLSSILNQLTANLREYILNSKDWKNVEITFFSKINAVNRQSATNNRISMQARSGIHRGVLDCQGSSYYCTILTDSTKKIEFQKEQWHKSYADDRVGGSLGSFGSDGGDAVADLLHRWVGRKFVVYNISDNTTGKTIGVKLEHWLNDNADGITWKKIHETSDFGGWGTTGAACGGAPDQIITWGGPVVALSWEGVTSINYKWLSVREIDPKGLPSVTPPPNDDNPPPNIVPPNVHSIYNILKVVYNVIYDSTGGCVLGFGAQPAPPNLNTTAIIPGNNSPVAIYGSGNDRAGEKVENTSSAIYNKIIVEVIASLKAVGGPTGTISCTIRKSGSDTIATTLGSIDCKKLTSNFQSISFTNLKSAYPIQSGDSILIEYSGGDSSNYVALDSNNTNVFDSTNSDLVTHSGSSYTSISASDAALVIYDSGTGQATPASQFYTVASNDTTVTLYNGGKVRYGEVAATASSALIGKVIGEVDVYLSKKSDTTTGTVYCRIRKGSDDSIAATIGQIDCSNIPTTTGSVSLISFVNNNNTYSMVQGDKILLEYNGGDGDTNFVRVDENLSAPYDGVNSCTTAYSGSTGGLTEFFNTPGPPGSYNANHLASDIDTRFGEMALNSSSALIGKVIGQVDAYLARSNGSVTGTVFCRIRKGSDDSIAATIGQVSATTIPQSTSQTGAVTSFVNTSNTYAIANGDKILIEYGEIDGVDSGTGYIRANYNNSNTFDGTNSGTIEYQGGYGTPNSGKEFSGNMFSVTAGSPTYTNNTATDIAGNFWTVGTGGSPPTPAPTPTFTTVYNVFNLLNLFHIPAFLNGVGIAGSSPAFRRVGETTYTSQSVLNGVVLKSVSFVLSKTGSPSGTLTATIRNGDTDNIVATMGTLDVSTLLTTSYTTIQFVNQNNTYALKEGDFIGVEYSGGDSSNYVMVDTNINDPFNGDNTVVAYCIDTDNGLYANKVNVDVCGIFGK